MSSNIKPKPLVEEIIQKEKPNESNKEIIINLKKNKNEEDETSTNSADYSGSYLNENQIQYQNMVKNNNSFPMPLSKRGLEKYQEKLKEKTMRMEIDKRYSETERLRKKYEELNSHVHTFDNNPQYQKMLKRVSNQLILIFLGGIIYLIYSTIIYFYTSKKKEGISILGICLSISDIALCIILFIALNFGLLNDPHLSKTFRLFIILETFVLISTLIFNIFLAFLSNKYLRKMKYFKNKFIVYFIFLLVILISFAIAKFCMNLFVESALILLGKKTEYSILIYNEQNLKKNEMNFNTNLSVSNDINTTGEGLVNSTALFNNDNKEKEKEKEEEEFKTFNYYNRFHASVTSSRQNDFKNFKNN